MVGALLIALNFGIDTKSKKSGGALMIKIQLMTISLILLAISYLGFSPMAVQASALRGKHASEGISCTDCHKNGKPTEASGSASCMECHGNYEKVAALTKHMHANPHDNHMGQIDCTKCHGIHKPTVVPCLECHVDFEFKMK